MSVRDCARGDDLNSLLVLALGCPASGELNCDSAALKEVKKDRRRDVSRGLLLVEASPAVVPSRADGMEGPSWPPLINCPILPLALDPLERLRLPPRMISGVPGPLLSSSPTPAASGCCCCWRSSSALALDPTDLERVRVASDEWYDEEAWALLLDEEGSADEASTYKGGGSGRDEAELRLGGDEG